MFSLLFKLKMCKECWGREIHDLYINGLKMRRLLTALKSKTKSINTFHNLSDMLGVWDEGENGRINFTNEVKSVSRQL